MKKIQYATVTKIENFYQCKRITIAPDGPTKMLADFKAGQFVFLNIKIGNKVISKPHSIASSPKNARLFYVFWIKDYAYGYTSKFINNNWKVGTKITLSMPQGKLCAQPKDSKHVIACCIGNATTPFLSMAHAVADGIEDYKLTIIHSVNYNKDLIFKPELLDILAKTKKVKLINLVSKEPSPDWLEGIIDEKIIKKVANGKPYTLLACGGGQFYDYMDRLAKKLKVPAGQYRKDYIPK